jgi:hypothetical protein
MSSSGCVWQISLNSINKEYVYDVNKIPDTGQDDTNEMSKHTARNIIISA